MATGSEAGKKDDVELGKIVEIAQRHYREKQSQKDIAEKLGISPTEVSRCIKQAEDLKIVEFVINPLFTEKLAAQIQKAFPHLKKVIVAPVMNVSDEKIASMVERLGLEAAEYIAAETPHNAEIGLGHGTAVEATVNHLVKLSQEGKRVPAGCKVYALMTFMMEEFVNVAPAALVASLMRWLPEAQGIAYQFPKADTWEEKDGYYKLKTISDFIEATKKLDYYILGIGFPDFDRKIVPRQHTQMASYAFNEIIHSAKIFNGLDGSNKLLVERLREDDMDAVGEILYQPYDKAGMPIEEKEKKIDQIGADGKTVVRKGEITLPIELRCFWLRLETLRDRVKEKRRTIMAVAGGRYKREAILAALKGEFFNVLVTDSLTAHWLAGQVQAEWPELWNKSL